MSFNAVYRPHIGGNRRPSALGHGSRLWAIARGFATISGVS
jgi:hypothetical protein